MNVTEFSTFYLFATSLAVGIAAMLPLVPLAQLGRRFFILLSLIAVALIALAVVDRGLETHYGLFACAGFLIAYNVVLPPSHRVDPGTRRSSRGEAKWGRWAASALLFSAIAAGVVGLVGDALTFSAEAGADEGLAALTIAAQLSSAALLGAAVVAMTLGHWYLVLRGASFGPLWKLTAVLAIAIVVRFLDSLATSIWQGAAWEATVIEAGWSRFLLADGVFVAARWLFGLLAPLLLIRLVWGCLRVESNQSATGILYVLVAFSFLGELLAKYYQLSGWIL